MSESDDRRRLDRRFDRLERALPDRVAGMLRRLRRPTARWVRVPAGILLMLGGIFSFLPVLGVWMLPLGVMLLAIDIPLLQGPTARLMVRAERRWTAWRRGGFRVFGHALASREERRET